MANNKLIFNGDNDGVRFVSYQHAELDIYSVVSLKQQSADRHVAPLEHIIMFPIVFFLLYDVHLAEKQLIPIA
jgi:hypothetical protein